MSELPANVRALLHRVDTFEKLEMIVALSKAPRAVMSITELAQALKIERELVRRSAVELRGGALVELTSSDEVQLLPPTSRDHDAVRELVRLYDDDRLMIVKALGQIAMQRIRNMASRAFADAFVIRKKAPGGDDG